MSECVSMKVALIVGIFRLSEVYNRGMHEYLLNDYSNGREV